ncbi:MAG: ATP-binding protein [Solirubrobacterales bacterium]|nr:ATP-binding protein [Solirubrobacterales bacterium]
MHGDGETITLAVRCSRSRLRIDVYDSSRSLPVTADRPADSETGRGLVLVAALSAGWGSFYTPAGKAVYFTPAFQPELPWAGDDAPGAMRGDGRA